MSQRLKKRAVKAERRRGREKQRQRRRGMKLEHDVPRPPAPALDCAGKLTQQELRQQEGDLRPCIQWAQGVGQDVKGTGEVQRKMGVGKE